MKCDFRPCCWRTENGNCLLWLLAAICDNRLDIVEESKKEPK